MRNLMEQYFQEMKIRKTFLTSDGFIIKTVDECEEYFQFLIDDIEEMISDFEDLIAFYVEMNDLHLKESSEDIHEYGKYRTKLQTIIERFEQKLLTLNIYLNQVKIPEKPYALTDMNEIFSVGIESADRYINIYKRLKFVPDLDVWLNEIYRCLEKYNQYIDIINQRNKFVKKTNQEYSKVEIPVIEHIENLKNWSPK